MNLNDREWKAFNLTDVFNIENIQRGKRLTKSRQISGSTPYVSSSSINNGVDNFISNDKKVRRFSNCISIANSGSVGSSFYHPYEFVASDHVTQLKNENMNIYVYLFIATITSRLSDKYNFNREINDKRIKREKIMLPINEDNQPDFDFMERYVKFNMTNSLNEYVRFANEAKSKIQFKSIVTLDEKEWKEFVIEDIFEIFSGVRLTKKSMIPGNMPFIGSSDSNNGITNFVSNSNGSLGSNVLGVNYNGSVCEAFYHPYECIFSDDVKHLKLRNCNGNKFLYLFISTVIRKQKVKYTYGYKFNENRMRRQKIMLPVDDIGDPDYVYMEQYAKNMMLNKYEKYSPFKNLT